MRSASLRKGLPTAGGVLGLALALRLVYGAGDIGYDAAHALVWGSDLIHGRLPDYRTVGNPTPHPLAALVSAPVSLLGHHAYGAMVALTFVALAALAWGGFRLGRACFAWQVGALFALLIVTRPLLVGETLEAFVDLPFLALVIWAAVLEAERPHRGTPVLLLLGASALLRPEGSLFAGAYALTLLPGRTLRERLRILGLVAAAPLLWAASDLAIAGDPLFSLHGTQQIAENLYYRRGLGSALSAMPDHLRALLEEPVLWGGFGGALGGLWFLYRRSLLPAALTAVGMVTFLALGIARLPILPRYLLPSGLGLALFCAVALAGWRLAGPRRLRLAWAAAAAVLAGFVIAGIGDTRRAIDKDRAYYDERRGLTDDLVRLGRTRAVQVASRTCRGPLFTLAPRASAILSLTLGRPRASIPTISGTPRGSLLLKPKSSRIAFVFGLGHPRPVTPARIDPRRPPGFTEVAGNRSWTLYQRC